MKATKVLRHTAIGMATGALALAGTLVGAGSAQAAFDPVTHSIWDDEPLYYGWHVDSKKARLIMLPDGDLVIYQTNFRGEVNAAWHSNTAGCGYKTVMQSDGNLVVYSANGGVCWALGTNGHPHAKLTVNDTGSVVVHWDTFGPTPHSGGSNSVALSSDLY